MDRDDNFKTVIVVVVIVRNFAISFWGNLTILPSFDRPEISVGTPHCNLIGLMYGDVPLFRGTFFQKMRNYGYQFLNYVRNYGYHLKKYAELWVPFWKNVAKSSRGTLRRNKMNDS